MTANWGYWRRFSRELREVAQREGAKVISSNRPQILRFEGLVEGAAYVRIDRTGDHWWGFTKSVHSYLTTRFDNWAFVLVDADRECCYVISRETVEVRIEDGDWSESARQWHIHSPNAAPLGSSVFSSVEDLFEHLTQLFGGAAMDDRQDVQELDDYRELADRLLDRLDSVEESLDECEQRLALKTEAHRDLVGVIARVLFDADTDDLEDVLANEFAAHVERTVERYQKSVGG